jgi:hypothetical protein
MSVFYQSKEDSNNMSEPLLRNRRQHDDEVVCRAEAVVTAKPGTPPKPSFRRGIVAFLVGAILSVFGWISNQGWTVLSLFLFGPFQYSFDPAWKHILFCTVGSLCTSLTWCHSFTYFFPERTGKDKKTHLICCFECVECDDDDDDEEDNPERDVSESLQELGELGFVVGYLTSQLIGIAVINRCGFAVKYENAQGPDSALLAGMLLLWFLFTKIKDHNKAVKRAIAA